MFLNLDRHKHADPNNMMILGGKPRVKFCGGMDYWKRGKSGRNRKDNIGCMFIVHELFLMQVP